MAFENELDKIVLNLGVFWLLRRHVTGFHHDVIDPGKRRDQLGAGPLREQRTRGVGDDHDQLSTIGYEFADAAGVLSQHRIEIPGHPAHWVILGDGERRSEFDYFCSGVQDSL